MTGQAVAAESGGQISCSKYMEALEVFMVPPAQWAIGLRVLNVGQRQVQQTFDAANKQAQKIVSGLCEALSDSAWSKPKKVAKFACHQAHRPANPAARCSPTSMDRLQVSY